MFIYVMYYSLILAYIGIKYRQKKMPAKKNEMRWFRFHWKKGKHLWPEIHKKYFYEDIAYRPLFCGVKTMRKMKKWRNEEVLKYKKIRISYTYLYNIKEKKYIKNCTHIYSTKKKDSSNKNNNIISGLHVYIFMFMQLNSRVKGKLRKEFNPFF